MSGFLMVVILGGGALGAIARASAGRLLQSNLPGATLLVNLSGSFLLAALHAALPPNQLLLHAALGTGFAGAFTTFSTFVLEILLLHRAGRPITAFAYLLLTVFLCCLASLAALVIFTPHGSSV